MTTIGGPRPDTALPTYIVPRRLEHPRVFIREHVTPGELLTRSGPWHEPNQLLLHVLHHRHSLLARPSSSRDRYHRSKMRAIIVVRGFEEVKAVVRSAPPRAHIVCRRASRDEPQDAKDDAERDGGRTRFAWLVLRVCPAVPSIPTIAGRAGACRRRSVCARRSTCT